MTDRPNRQILLAERPKEKVDVQFIRARKTRGLAEHFLEIVALSLRGKRGDVEAARLHRVRKFQHSRTRMASRFGESRRDHDQPPYLARKANAHVRLPRLRAR